MEAGKLLTVEVVVEHSKGRQTTKFAKVVNPSSIVVAGRVPEVDRCEAAGLRANLVVADVVIEVGELLTVKVMVERSKSRPTAKIAKVVGPSSIVVAERAPKVGRCEVAQLLAKLVVADVVMEAGKLLTVEVVVEHSKGRQTDKVRESSEPRLQSWLRGVFRRRPP